jgi:aspartyl-tRNA(Asn)/glutamyl-tRNA(Gln) amidotransferase subunit A
LSDSAGVEETSGRVRSGASSAVEVARAAMARVVNGESGPARANAFVSFDYENALAQAERIDESTERDRLELAGVPIAVKDNICTVDMPTTCASRFLADYRSPYDATVVRRLRAAGAVIVGKTNLDEFGMGSSTENSAFGVTPNPHDASRVAGGSSGGSAAAVALGMVPAALGSETGGSVRQPAAFCGVVGLKPSYGRVSRYGLVAHASSLDQVGVFGRTVADAARVLEIIAGWDPLDATTADLAVPGLTADLDEGVAGLVIGVPREYFPPELDPGISSACRETVERFRALGAEVREVSLPHSRFAVPAYYVIATAEASANLARFDGVRYGVRAVGATTADVVERSRSAGFGAEVKRRIMLGTFALSAGYHDEYYGTAQRVRTRIRQDFDRVFDTGVDLLFTPTTPTTAFRIGEKTADPYAMYLSDVFTVTANLAALPAMSVPIGRVDHLPIGGQLIAPRWREEVMIRAASALERNRS